MEQPTSGMRPDADSINNIGPRGGRRNMHSFGSKAHPVGHIYDIGGSDFHELLAQNLRNTFIHNNLEVPRSFPSELFFSGKGLSKWSKITELPEFYQTKAEIDLLQYHGANIANEIAPGSTLIDMGCGDTQKILPLLLHLEQARIPVDYYALDISFEPLKANVDALISSPMRKFTFVRCFGLWGTFRNGFDLIKSIESSITILSLGSMFGNDKFDSAVSRLIPWARIMKPDDRMLLGLDSEWDKEEIWASYHDYQGTWEEFIRNGLRTSNELLDHKWYRDEDWQVGGSLKSDPTVHNFTILARNSVTVPELGLDFSAGDSIDFFESWKYKPEEMRRQFKAAGLQEIKCWASPGRAFLPIVSPFKGKFWGSTLMYPHPLELQWPHKEKDGGIGYLNIPYVSCSWK